jgi:hypothetical protein
MGTSIVYRLIDLFANMFQCVYFLEVPFNLNFTLNLKLYIFV